jgi:hypothetical protein
MLVADKPLIVAVEVCEQTIGTKSNAPVARVRVLHVVHAGPEGGIELGEHQARFQPPSDESFYAIRNGPEAHERWKAAAHASPAAGARIIFAASRDSDGALGAWPLSIRPDTEAERARLRTLLETAP